MAEPIWLIDGSAFIYRSFYASGNMSRSDGVATGAIYLLSRFIMRLIRDEKPKHIAFVLDGKGKNFRHELYTPYKANRDKTPEALIEQLEPIKKVVQALGVHLEVSQNCEADDCIASLAYKYREKYPVIIVGADKDLRQCLHEQVMMWDPSAKNEKIVTLDDFSAETGLQANQWADLQALTGDSSDNIPGLAGVGPKTALKILHEYPSLEAIYENFDSLPEKMKLKFKDQFDLLKIYRELTRLKTDVCALSLEDLNLKKANVNELLEIFSEYELNSLSRELQSMQRAGVISDTGSASVGEAVKKDDIKQNEQFSLFGASAVKKEDLVCDTVAKLQAVEKLGILYNNNKLYLHINNTEYQYTGDVGELFEFASKAKNIYVYDLKSLYKHNNIWQNIELDKCFDVFLAAYLLHPEEVGVSYERLIAGLASELEHRNIVSLGNYLEKELKKAELDRLLTELELPLVPVLFYMQEAGIMLDKAKITTFLQEVHKDLELLTSKIYELAGTSFNIRSSKQLGEILFERLGLKKAGKTRGGQAKTDQESLEKLAGSHEIIDTILEYRKLEKMRSTYLEPLPRLADANGRVHTQFNQTATVTGRLSSSNPNLQNIPIRGEHGKRMRTCFTASTGNLLISADYSQIELRVLAHLSQEKALLDAFNEGADIHARTASLLYDLPINEIDADKRRDAKTINFGLVYGMGAQSLASQLQITTAKAKEFIANYFKQLPGLKEFYDGIEYSAKELGMVRTLTGRRRLLPEIYSQSSMVQSQARRQAINTVVQGLAADIIKFAMLEVYNSNELKELGAKLILQVHDELLLEVPSENAKKASELVIKLMSEIKLDDATLSVPLLVEAGIGDSWGSAH